MSEKIKLSLIILVAGILWGAYESYDFANGEQVRLIGELEAKKTSVSTQKNELDKLKSFSGKIDEIKGRLKKTNLEYEELLDFIPRTLDYAKLLAKMNSLAQNSGIDVEFFKPKPKDPTKTFAAPVEAVEGANDMEKKEVAPKFFEEVEFELKLRGGFSQTLMFLDQVSRLKRIINVENLTMNSEQNEQKRVVASGAIPIETTATIKTYKFIE